MSSRGALILLATGLAVIIGLSGFPLGTSEVLHARKPVKSTEQLPAPARIAPGSANSSGRIELATIAAQYQPLAVAVNESSGWAYVINTGASSTSVVNGTSSIAAVRVGAGPCDVAWDPYDGYVYVVDGSDWNVSVIRGTSVIATLRAGDDPVCGGGWGGISVDPSSGLVYVPNLYSDNVTVISGNAIVGSIGVGVRPTYSAYDPSDGFVYVANVVSRNVSVINGTRVVGTIPLNDTPVSCSYDPFLRTAIIGQQTAQGGQLTFANGSSAVGKSTVGTVPYTFAVNPTDGSIYIPNGVVGALETVSVIQGNSEVTLPVGARPQFAEYDPVSGYVFIANYGSANVTVINGTTVLGSIPVGIGPYALTFDPANDYVYVPNSGSANVTVLDGSSAYPSLAALGANPANVTVGSETLLSTTTGGPASAWTFAYAGLPSGCSTANVSVLPCAPGAPGAFLVRVTGWSSWGINGSASATLVVIPSTVTSFVADPSVVEIGSRTNATTRFLITVLGGVAPLTYNYAGLPGGCLSSDITPLNCTPQFPGSFNVQVTVSDGAGNTILANASLLVVPQLTVSVRATPIPTEVGRPVSFDAVTFGGLQPITSEWVTSDGIRSNAAPLIHAFPTAGSYVVQLWANDSLGGQAYGSVSVAVVARLTAGVSIDNASLRLGEGAVLSISATGGAPPYVYAYAGLPAGCASANSSSLQCTPTVAGPYRIEGIVRDTIGDQASANVTLAVEFAIVVSAPATAYVGERFTIVVKPAEAGGPITFAFQGLPDGCESANASALNCTPAATGTFTIQVQAMDSWGRQANGSVIVHVVVPGLSETTWIEIGALLGAAFAGAAGLVVWVRTRRRGGGAAPSSQNPQA